jgi:3-methyladenine DNA glycosylase/8-oxoguanine DNA glycosylase
MKNVVREFTLHAPSHFDFWRTAYSHGWCDLPPFSFDEEKKELSRVLLLSDDVPAFVVLRGRGRTMRGRMESAHPFTTSRKREIITQLRTCLRLDEDFSEFHRSARNHPAFRWIATTGSGRMLRSPTVWEDVVKMICTTNCTWALTKLMVTNLVGHFGKKFNATRNTFPTPESIAASSETYLRKHIKAGYRSPYLIELAERVASGKLDLQSWRTSNLTTDELFTHMREVKGIGPYAASNLMKLVGHYDYLGLDSWVRGQYYALHHNGRKVKDATIERHYRKYGKWRGLFFWLEMTRYWHDKKFGPG